VIDIVGGGEADGKAVGDGVLAYCFILYKRLGKVQGQLITGRAEGQKRGVVLSVAGAVGVRKSAPPSGKIGLPGTVVSVAEKVLGCLARQFPLGAGVALGVLFGVPLHHPLGIAVVVVVAGDELAGHFGKPEGLAGVAGHGHGPAVFDRNAEHLGPAAGAAVKLIPKVETRVAAGERLSLRAVRWVGSISLLLSTPPAGGQQPVPGVLNVGVQ
jgi:hypothetical protein